MTWEKSRDASGLDFCAADFPFFILLPPLKQVSFALSNRPASLSEWTSSHISPLSLIRYGKNILMILCKKKLFENYEKIKIFLTASKTR